VNPPREELVLLADEYVLGLLDPSEVEAFEAHLEHDRDLQGEVAAARERLLQFDLTAEPVEPSPALWTRIETVISRSDATLAPQRVQPRIRPPAGGTHRATRRWRTVSIIGLAASVLLAVALGWRVVAPPAPAVIAVLLDDQGDPVALIEDYGDDRVRVIPLADIDLPQDRALEVWTLPDPDAGPVSFGLLQEVGSATLEGPDLPPPTSDQLYEITIEAETGSPTGGPTGPIVGKGFARVPR
jgi:anti-sigma-K factor RskA